MSADGNTELTAGASGRPERVLTPFQRFTFSVPQIGVNMSGTILGSWLMFFLVPPEGDVSAGRAILIAAGVYGWLELWGRVVDSVSDPVIGHWSDRTRSRFGRRMPFIVLGTPVMALSYLLLWFLPFEPGSAANALYLGAVLTVYWIAFTVVLGPYSALLPEVETTSRGRIVLSSVMGLLGAAGAIAGILSGEVISAFPDGATLAGIRIPSGIQLVAVFGAASLLLCVVPMLNVRESPHDRSKDVTLGIWESVGSATKNPAFLPVVGIAFFFKLAGAMVLTVMPYLTTQVLERGPGEPGLVAAGMGEAWQSRLLAIVMVGAVLWMPFLHRLGERFSHKRMMIVSGALYAVSMLLLPAITLLPDPAWGAVGIMLLLTFPTSIALIMPPVLFADVIDYDETRTGLRREGIYNGAVAFLTKWSEGLAKVVVVGLLAYGASRSNPLGIHLVGLTAGVAMLLGLYTFRRFPQEAIDRAVSALRASRTASPGASPDAATEPSSAPVDPTPDPAAEAAS